MYDRICEQRGRGTDKASNTAYSNRRSTARSLARPGVERWHDSWLGLSLLVAVGVILAFSATASWGATDERNPIFPEPEVEIDSSDWWSDDEKEVDEVGDGALAALADSPFLADRSARGQQGGLPAVPADQRPAYVPLDVESTILPADSRHDRVQVASLDETMGPGNSDSLADQPQIAATSTDSGNDEPWYSWIWPLGERVEVEALKDEYVPFKGAGEIPERPGLFIEVGDPFLDTDNLSAGFEIPFLGAVWQPRLWSYFIYRTAFQSFDNGAPGRERDTEWANRLDFFANLQLTGTEKLLLQLRPLDQNRPDRFTRYSFDGANTGWEEELNLDIEALFFEGDIGSLVPALDTIGTVPLDLGFTAGRQGFTFQEGILINDTLDAVGFIRNNIPFPGTSNLRVSALWGWSGTERNDEFRQPINDLYGLFIAADAPVSTYNLDMIYVNDAGNADGFYIGASAIQRIRSLGNLSTAFRVNTSIALEDEVEGRGPGDVIGTGSLITAEFSKTPHGSNDLWYFNPFLAVGNFTQAGREPILGGPLANTGILFASPNLSLYGAEINPFTEESVGAALGYQAFWDSGRRNLILEVAGRHDYSSEGFDSIGLGFQLQQAIGQHVQLQFESFYAFNEDRDDGAGGRFEIQVVY